MSVNLLAEQRKKYQARLKRHGDSVLSTFQNDEATQFLRFEQLLKHILPQPKRFSIHDIGSGLCDLHRYLKQRGIDHDYSGTEIVPEMIEISQKKFPGIRLTQRDFVKEGGEEKYDFVVLSGTLNLQAGIPRKEWVTYVERLLIKMFRQALGGIAFNFLSTHRTFTDPELCYFDPGRLFDFCRKKLSRFVVLDHATPLYEATLTVFQPAYMKTKFDPPAFRKYFRGSR